MNPALGTVVYYWLKNKPQDEVTLEFLDASGKSIKKFSSKPAEKAERAAQAGSAEEEEAEQGPRGGRSPKLPAEEGLNRFEWDLRYPDATGFPGMILWAGGIRGPLVVPGTYQVKLTANGKTQTQKFEVRQDPRIQTTPEQYLAQLELELQLRDKLTQTNKAVVEIRDVRKQIDELTARLKASGETEKSKAVADRAKSLNTELTSVEEALYQTKNRASEDPLNFPVRLNNKLAALLSAVAQSDSQPTASQQQVYEDLATGINAQINKLKQIMDSSVPALNRMVKEQEIPAITVKTAGSL